MSKFRKLPVVIDAEQYLPPYRIPGGVCCYPRAGGGWGASVHTLEGQMEVSEGDWVITGVKGEKYPCKDEIFRLTYEPVEGQP